MYCSHDGITTNTSLPCTVDIATYLFDLVVAGGTWHSLFEDPGEVMSLNAFNVIAPHDGANSLTSQ